MLSNYFTILSNKTMASLSKCKVRMLFMFFFLIKIYVYVFFLILAKQYAPRSQSTIRETSKIIIRVCMYLDWFQIMSIQHMKLSKGPLGVGL